MRSKPDYPDRLQAAGFNFEDASALRRIAMTLDRWHELECGDSGEHFSSVLVRGRKENGAFIYDDNGAPFFEEHDNRPVQRGVRVNYYPTPDRERGALKRLAAIMARYPAFASYVQGDPRGCSLYILRPEDLNGSPAGSRDSSAFGEWLSANYSRGIGVYK